MLFLVAMKLIEPAVRLIGHLSFRNKLRATALVFGLPLLLASGLLVYELQARVSALKNERADLSLQVQTLSLLGNLHQIVAAGQAVQEGDTPSEAPLAVSRNRAKTALGEYLAGFDAASLKAVRGQEGPAWLERRSELLALIEQGSPDEISALIPQLRADFERMNESAGLLIDSDTASSRLLDIVTAHLPGLIETNGQAARLGTSVLLKKSVRGSRRTDLTLQRGNFDALVLWSMDGLQKVAGEHPAQAAALSEAGALMNTAYLGVQEAITVKMLDTTDYDMEPTGYLDLTAKAMDATLAVGGILVAQADLLLSDRLSVLQTQRNIVVAVMAIILAIVAAGFVAAYISIMRGLNGLASAVNTMAEGNLDARVDVTSRDEIGAVGTQFNNMAESLAERTSQLREKTNDIHGMLQNMTQGILTIMADGKVHPEYSAYLETIFETADIAHRPALDFLFASGDVGADALSQVEATVASCIGEDRMNFDFNAHLLVSEVRQTWPDGRAKYLDLVWSPICDENDVVEKLMVCVRDVTELRQLVAEAEHQKRELDMIGQILKVTHEKFHDFIDSSRRFIVDNEALLQSAGEMSPDLVTQLFRNMHTIKGNARTYGLLHMTNVVHQAEQSYEALRQGHAVFAPEALLGELDSVRCSLEEYAHLNDVTLGRKGPGRRGSAEKYVMVEHGHLAAMIGALEAYDLQACHRDTLVALVRQIKTDLNLIGTESIASILAPVFESLPSLATELHKEAPRLVVSDHGIRLRNQVSDLLRNVFMHLYRNSMDHGVEVAVDRLEKGKTAAGTIALNLSLTSEHLKFSLSDDGKGLALGHIRRKAIDKGLIAEGQTVADETVANLIFAAGFSTATAVTEVSGRGVGMDAVQDFIKREGGKIALHFVDDRVGEEFRAFETVIELPAKFAVLSIPLQETPGHRPVSLQGLGPLLPVRLAEA